MKTAAFVLAAASAAGIASAQFQYAYDDGSAEDSIGLTNGGTFNWGNMYDVDSMNTLLESIEIGFGDNIAGSNITWAIMGDNDNDPTTGLTVLASGSHTVVDDTALTTGGFDTINIGSVDVAGFSQFMVGAQITHVGGTFPAAVDQTTSLGRSWIGFGGVMGDGVSDYSGSADIIDNFGLPGNWLLRANVVPTPGAVGLLAVAGIGAARRRR